MRRLIVTLVANGLGLWFADRLIDGISFKGSLVELGIAALVFTAINWILRPLVKLLFGPVILLTLGLFILVINAAMLWLADRFVDELAISGISALLLGTLVIGFVNIIFSPIKSHHD